MKTSKLATSPFHSQQTSSGTHGTLDDGRFYVSSGVIATRNGSNDRLVIPGIRFYGYSTDSTGNYEWVQIVHKTTYYGYGPFDLLPHVQTNEGLDTTYPYLSGVRGPSLPNRSGLSNGVHVTEVKEALDGPAIWVDSAYFGTRQDLTMYLMYQPAGAAPDDWVPLESIKWHYYGENNRGTITSNISPSGYGVDTTLFPEWSQVVGG